MMKTKPWTSIVVLLIASMIAAGCQTYGQAGGLGAAIGAGSGALIGSGSGHALEGALIGGALGGVAGLVAHDVKARKAKAAAATAADYNYNPSQGEVLRLENAKALPSVVNRGQLVQATAQYALLGVPANGIGVTETRQLRHGNDILAESSSTVTRTAGTWVTNQEFELPPTSPAGEYQIVQTIQTPTNRIMGTASFLVQ